MHEAELHPYKVDPRVCGGDGCLARLCRFDLGRSPRVRGRHDKPSFHDGRVGSIPACAGETVCLLAWCCP